MIKTAKDLNRVKQSLRNFKSARASMSEAVTDNNKGWVTAWVEGKGVAGVNVSPSTALQVATYYACMRNVAEDVAKLPLILYAYIDAKRKAKEPDFDHPIFELLNSRPSEDMTDQTFRELLITYALAWGNGCARIITEAGYPTALIPLEPWRVKIYRAKSGRVVYTHTLQDGTRTTYAAEEIIHMHGVGSDGVRGYSVAEYAANTMGLALSSQEHVAQYFANGAVPTATLETDKAFPKPEQIHTLREQWHETYSGPKNAGKVIILEGGMKYKPIALPLKDVQFLELRRFEKEEIASLFRMPLNKLQDATRAQGWSTYDAYNTDYLNDCIGPWMLRERKEFGRKLLTPEEQKTHCIKQDTKMLLMMDAKTRSEFNKAMVGMGAKTPNEVRIDEDENPSTDPAADKLYMQGAMMPIDKLGQQQVAPSGFGKKSSPEKEEGDENPEDEKDPVDALFSLTLQRFERKESKALADAEKKYSTAETFNRWANNFYSVTKDQALGELSLYLTNATDLKMEDVHALQSQMENIFGEKLKAALKIEV